MLSDANLDLAVEAIKNSRIVNSGQICNCAGRVCVHHKIADALTDRLAKAMKASKFGNPLEDLSVDYGPLTNQAGLSKVEDMVSKATKDGATVVTGGRRGDRGKGWFYEPTVLADCRQEMEIVQKEIFGPVVPVVAVEDLDQAIDYANDSTIRVGSSCSAVPNFYAPRRSDGKAPRSREPKGEFDRCVIGTIAGHRPGANVTKAAREHMIENESIGRLHQVVGLGHVHMRQPEPDSLSKQKVGLLTIMGVEITGPYDWPAMVCDFFADRSKLTPERFEIEREVAGEIQPMRVGDKQFIAAAGNTIDGDDAALRSANDGLPVACQQDLRSNWVGNRAGRAAGKAVTIADRVRHDVAVTADRGDGRLRATPSTMSRHFLQSNYVSVSSQPWELATEALLCAFVDVPIEKSHAAGERSPRGCTERARNRLAGFDRTRASGQTNCEKKGRKRPQDHGAAARLKGRVVQ